MGMRIDPEQLDEIKSRRRMSDVLRDCGIKVTGRMCLCPFHMERTPSCQVFDREARIYCHACHEGWDVIDVIMKLTGRTFPETIEFLGGARDLTPKDREKMRAQREQMESVQKEANTKARKEAHAMFDAGQEIKGSLVQTYLRGRRISVSKRMWFDLRFAPSLPYWGFPDAKATETVHLGDFPAMLAAIRIPETKELIGCHRTFLDPETCKKLIPPGDAKRNKAKKIKGEVTGGMVHLSPPADDLIIGEGIETALSGYDYDVAGPKAAVAAAVSISNLAGSAERTVEHPKYQQRRVPNTIFDKERQGLLPPSWAKSIFLLGDGDSESIWTTAMIATAARKFRAHGLDAFVLMAPEGKDFNDVLMEAE